MFPSNSNLAAISRTIGNRVSRLITEADEKEQARTEAHDVRMRMWREKQTQKLDADINEHIKGLAKNELKQSDKIAVDAWKSLNKQEETE